MENSNVLYDICGFYCQAYEEEFSYCAKYDEVCGIAIAPDTGVVLYPHNESCYFPIDELYDY